MNSLTKDFDIGVYEFVFKIDLQDPSQSDIYATGGQSRVKIFVTGLIKVDNVEISVVDRDCSVETWKMLDLSADNFLSLSANHLQKLWLSFQLVSPLGKAFKPHQALLNLRHERKVENVFVVGSSGNKLEMTLDFLGLAKKSYYLSGKYDVQLIVGDAAMENSFIRYLGHVDLDLPEAPLSATPRPLPPMDPHSRFGPKAEITHIIRAPRSVKIGDFVVVADLDETAAAVFTALVYLALLWFMITLYDDMGVNFDYFPTSARYVILSKFYHISIGALLCFIFWLDLCGTVVVFILIGAFMEFAGGPLVLHLRLMRIAEAKSLAKRKKRYLKKLKKLAEKKQIVSVST